MTDPQQDPRVSLAEDRTEMAAYRTSLALDRTTLAWVRTTLSMSSFGLGMIGFFRTLVREGSTPESIRLHQGAIHFGVALVILGVISTILVASGHISAVRELRSGQMPKMMRWPLTITISFLLSLMALAGLWALFY
jgi:putative membrane protein